MNDRIEKDLLGEKKIPMDAYYGIHAQRAQDNFSVSHRPVHFELIQAFAQVKKAAALTNASLGTLDATIGRAIVQACDEIVEGKFRSSFIVDALQGGAGTSTNMNVNEVIANRAIEILGGQKGDYSMVHPLNHVNQSQSTNDVYPTALRIAAIRLLRQVSEFFADLQTALQEKENEFADIIKLGRTELMDGLPMMVGQSFGSYAQCIGRDRWRLYKVEERLRQINIGGTAIGTGLNATNKYIYMVTDTLQRLTGLGLARSEFPMDITQNTDVLVEVSGLLKAAAVNLQKISNDLRLLSSGPQGGLGEYNLAPVQAGSSIMPGKVNPVIPEMIAQVSMEIIGNDYIITMASGNGQLELNAFYPLLADKLLGSLKLFAHAVPIFTSQCIRPIEINPVKCWEHLEKSSALVTALVHHIGYDACSEIAKKSVNENKSIKQVVQEMSLFSVEKIEEIFNPYELTKPGIPGK